MSDKLLEMLVKLESSLHTETVRRSGEKLEALLHEHFEEVGASGRTYTRHQAIDLMAGELEPSFEASDFVLQVISQDVALLRYTLFRRTREGNALRSLRSSIWVHEHGSWKLFYHQGTVAP